MNSSPTPPLISTSLPSHPLPRLLKQPRLKDADTDFKTALMLEIVQPKGLEMEDVGNFLSMTASQTSFLFTVQNTLHKIVVVEDHLDGCSKIEIDCVHCFKSEE